MTDGTCPQVKFLVTSRRPLRVNGEHEYPLASLGLPPEAAPPRPGELLGFASARLLTDRIRAVLPGWTMRADDAAAVAGICRRLDGLPLALELAAAMFSQVGDRSGVARALDGMARASAALGGAPGAAWLLGHADSLHEQVGEQFSAYEITAREQTMGRHPRRAAARGARGRPGGRP
jgi:hypothetical protein